MAQNSDDCPAHNLRQAFEVKDSEQNLHTVPRYCSLDGFAELSSERDGIVLATLAVRDVILALTQNSRYHITLVNPETGEATVQGGSFFAEPALAAVCGSSFGGCMLKTGWLGIGLRIEICSGGQRIVTSPVREIIIERAA